MYVAYVFCVVVGLIEFCYISLLSTLELLQQQQTGKLDNYFREDSNIRLFWIQSLFHFIILHFLISPLSSAGTWFSSRSIYSFNSSIKRSLDEGVNILKVPTRNNVKINVPFYCPWQWRCDLRWRRGSEQIVLQCPFIWMKRSQLPNTHCACTNVFCSSDKYTSAA